MLRMPVTHHGANIEQRGIGPLILWYALNSTLLDVELSGQPLKFRISRVAILEALAGNSASIAWNWRVASRRTLFDIVVVLFVRHFGNVSVN